MKSILGTILISSFIKTSCLYKKALLGIKGVCQCIFASRPLQLFLRLGYKKAISHTH